MGDAGTIKIHIHVSESHLDLLFVFSLVPETRDVDEERHFFGGSSRCPAFVLLH